MQGYCQVSSATPIKNLLEILLLWAPAHKAEYRGLKNCLYYLGGFLIIISIVCPHPYITLLILFFGGLLIITIV